MLIVVAPSAIDRLEHAAQEVRVGAVAVLGRELHVGAQVAREAHRQLGLLEHLVGRHAQLLLHVQRAGGDEGVDARRFAAGFSASAARAMSRSLARASEHTVESLMCVGNGCARLEVAVARGRETGLDHIDAQALQLARDAQLFVLGHRRAGRLLAVAQGGVEDDQLVAHGLCLLSCVERTVRRARPSCSACARAPGRTAAP